MDIAIPLFDSFTALDAVGPYRVLAGLPKARARFESPRSRGHSYGGAPLPILHLSMGQFHWEPDTYLR